jgi:hypothetical protein
VTANLPPAQYAGSWEECVDLPSYISGYVDGEGCFTVSISPRPTLKVGWEVRPSVSVSQNHHRNEVLLAIQDYFGCGTMRPDRSDKTVKWEVRSLTSIRERILPHFRRWPLISGKRADFELFDTICALMAGGFHRRPEGLIRIAEMASCMNPSGSRIYHPSDVKTSLSKMKA